MSDKQNKPNIISSLTGDFSEQLTVLLQGGLSTPVLLLTDTGEIRDCNNAFLHIAEVLDMRDLKSIDYYLDRESLESIMNQKEEGREANLTFKTKDNTSLLLHCHISRKAGLYLIIGNRPFMFESDSMNTMTKMHAELANLTREVQRKNRELTKAKEKIKILGGLIPICASCKKIRDDNGFWQQLESYVSEHSEATFSHGICDSCLHEQYPDIADTVIASRDAEQATGDDE